MTHSKKPCTGLLLVALFMGGVRLFATPASPAHSWHWRGNELLWGSEVVGVLNTQVPEGLKVKRSIARIEPRLFKVTNRLRAVRDLTEVSFRFDFVHRSPPEYLLIPAVSYNGNHWGQGQEPKGFKENGVVRSYEYRRAAIPGATYSEGPRQAIALWGVEQRRPQDLMFSCALDPGQAQVTHSLIYPDMEQPNSYSGRDVYTNGYTHRISLPRRTELSVVFYVYADRAAPQHRSIRGFLDCAWRQAAKPVFPVPSAGEIYELAMDYAAGSLWWEEGPYKGFGIGLSPNATGGFSPRASWKYEIGWCGNNALFATAFLHDYLVQGRPASLEKALACLDTWTTGTVLSNGLFVTHYDNLLSSREGLLDACNLGAAAAGFFEAATLCTRAGHDRPQLREIALGICRFMLRDQQPSGQYGKGWKYDGTCVHREGTIGAFLIPPMIQAAQASGDPRFLASARKAFDFYLGQLLRDGYTTAGALDTWCIDCESALPLLRAALMLHEATGQPDWLDHAETVSYYIASWQWHYSAAYPPEHDFTRYRYHAFGASGVSTQHHHISSHTLGAVPDWLELSRRTRNPIWAERARALWHNSAQLISDGSLRVNGRLRPRGSQNEAFFQSHWCFYKDKSHAINDWLVAWPSAFRLDVLRRVRDWNQLDQPVVAASPINLKP